MFNFKKLEITLKKIIRRTKKVCKHFKFTFKTLLRVDNQKRLSKFLSTIRTRIQRSTIGTLFLNLKLVVTSKILKKEVHPQAMDVPSNFKN